MRITLNLLVVQVEFTDILTLTLVVLLGLLAYISVALIRGLTQ
jgi:hypothetical protein